MVLLIVETGGQRSGIKRLHIEKYIKKYGLRNMVKKLIKFRKKLLVFFVFLCILCIIGGMCGCQTNTKKQLKFIQGDLGACFDNQAIISKAQINIRDRVIEMEVKQVELEKRIQNLEKAKDVRFRNPKYKGE